LPAPPDDVGGMNVTPGASGRLFQAELKAWRTDVVLDVVDRSIEAARIAREKARAEEARREAMEQEARRREAEDLRRREETEAEDARRLAEWHRAMTR